MFQLKVRRRWNVQILQPSGEEQVETYTAFFTIECDSQKTAETAVDAVLKEYRSWKSENKENLPEALAASMFGRLGEQLKGQPAHLRKLELGAAPNETILLSDGLLLGSVNLPVSDEVFERCRRAEQSGSEKAMSSHPQAKKLKWEAKTELPELAKKHRLQWKKQHSLFAVFCLVFLMLGCALALWIYHTGQYPRGSDIYGHLEKTDFLYRSIREGNWFPTYMPEWYNGIQPFRYWAPLSYYVLAAFEFLTGGNVLNAYLIFTGMAFCFGGIGWLLFGLRSNRLTFSFLLGLLWFFLPDNLRVYFSEGNLPRMLTAVLLPYFFVCLWSFLTEGRRKSLFGIIIWIAVLTWTHLMIAAMTAVAVTLFCLFHAISFRDIRRPGFTVLGMGCGFVLCGIWILPALKGGMVSLDAEASVEAMKGYSAPIRESLNPLLRLDGGQDLFYFGLAILLIVVVGLLFSRKCVRCAFLTTLLLFFGTTTAALPLLEKLPFNQLFWMQRFTPVAAAFCLAALLEWKEIGKGFLALCCVVMLADSTLSLTFLSPDERHAGAEERQELRMEEMLLPELKASTKQRAAILDLSLFGSMPSYTLPSVGEQTLYAFGWAWQGAEIGGNLVSLNTALEEGHYAFVFDRTLELGCDSVLVRRELAEDELDELAQGAARSGYNCIDENEQVLLFHRDTPERFGVKSTYSGLAIGRNAAEISLLYPQFELGESTVLEDYSLAELCAYEVVYLSGFSYHDRTKAEQLAQKLSESGVTVLIDMDHVPADGKTNRLSFLGVSAQEFVWNGEDYRYQNVMMPAGIENEQETVCLNGTSFTLGSVEQNGETRVFLGRGENENLLFSGMNLVHRILREEDASARAILSDVVGLDFAALPERELVAIDVRTDGKRLQIISPDDGVNTTLAFQDQFQSSKPLSSHQNLLTVGRGTTVISFVQPLRRSGILVSLLGVVVTLLCLLRAGTWSGEKNA